MLSAVWAIHGDRDIFGRSRDVVSAIRAGESLLGRLAFGAHTWFWGPPNLAAFHLVYQLPDEAAGFDFVLSEELLLDESLFEEPLSPPPESEEVPLSALAAFL